MKTWQMIKELTENPNKVFKLTKDGSKVTTYKGKTIVWKNTMIEPELNIHDEWEEIKEPVDFMTAFKAFSGEECKNISCISEYGEVKNYYYGSPECYYFSEEDIELGKWYILD